MPLKKFRTVTQHMDGFRTRRRLKRNALKESESYGISDVNLVTLSVDVPAGEREVAINQFYQDIRSMNSEGTNLILTAISF